MEDYITSVLETGNHGPCRHIPFDLQTLDATVHKFAHKIGDYRTFWGSLIHILIV